MSQPNTLESFCQLLDATDAWDFEDEVLKMGDLDDLETEPSHKGAEPDPAGNSSNQKRSFFTEQQVQGLQALFEKHPHPSRDQRKELGRTLGMTPLQIRNWFEKRRKKWEHERVDRENTFLKAEIERLQAENAKYREALSISCPKCGGETTLNGWYSAVNDMNTILDITSKYVKEPSASNYSLPPSSSCPPYQFPDRELAIILGQFNAEAPKM